MLNTKNAGSLIAGGPANERKIRVRLLVDKGVNGEMHEAGEEVVVTPTDAGWLVRRKYAELIKS